MITREEENEFGKWLLETLYERKIEELANTCLFCKHYGHQKWNIFKRICNIAHGDNHKNVYVGMNGKCEYFIFCGSTEVEFF